MDPVTLATAAVSAALPYLVKLGKEAAKGAAGAAGKSVWEWMTGKLTSESGKEAVRDLEAKPDDPINRSALEAALSKYLRSDKDAADQLTSLLKQSGAFSVGGDNIVTANTGAAAGRDMTGNTITITAAGSKPKA